MIRDEMAKAVSVLRAQRGTAARPPHRGQRGYYDLPEAARVLAVRTAVVATHVPPGSTVLDLGCNDGRISMALMDAGLASAVIGVDLEDLRIAARPGFTFRRADLTTVDLATLPPADVCLCLNVLHHVVWRASPARAAEIVAHLAATIPVTFVDMGSHTERGKWGWRRVYRRLWPGDEAMWKDIFGDVRREAILRYPAHGGGERTLWKLWRGAR